MPRLMGTFASVDAVESSREVTVYGELWGEEQQLLDSPDGQHFRTVLQIPDDAAAGEQELVLVAHDAAGNRFERRERIHIRARLEAE